MLAFDKNKTMVWTPYSYLPVNTQFLSENTAAPFAQLRGCDCGGSCPECSGLGDYETGSGYNPNGLGFTDIAGSLNDMGGTGIIDAVQAGATFVPGVGPIFSGTIAIVRTAVTTIESWLGIGKGRREADVITPVQNQLANRLGAIWANKEQLNCEQLQQGYVEQWQLGLAFMEFVLRPEFTDRRASGQALNGIMPMIDGTCGYAEPLGHQAIPTQRGNCTAFGVNWGDGGLGDFQRRMAAKGCPVPALGQISQAAQTGVVPPGVTPQTPLPPARGTYIPGSASTFQSFMGNIQQYAPYLLAGLAFMLFTRSTKG